MTQARMIGISVLAVFALFGIALGSLMEPKEGVLAAISMIAFGGIIGLLCAIALEDLGAARRELQRLEARLGR